MNIPDTTDFMILGFTVIFVPMIIYVISLATRYKKYKADIIYLENEE